MINRFGFVKTLLFVFLFVFADCLSAVCTTTLDVGGKSIINLGDPIDDTSALTLEDAKNYFPYKGTSFYNIRYLTPVAPSSMSLSNARAYCYHFKDSDMVKTEDGLYYKMDPDLTSSNIYSREDRGDYWTLMSSRDAIQVQQQAVVKGSDSYILVSQFGLLNTGGFFENDPDDNGYYWFDDTTFARSNDNDEKYAVGRLNYWKSNYSEAYHAAGRFSPTYGYYTIDNLKVRCVK